MPIPLAATFTTNHEAGDYLKRQATDYFQLIKPYGASGGDMGSLIGNFDRPATTLTRGLAKEYLSAIRQAAQHYSTSNDRLPEPLTQALIRVGRQLSLVSGDTSELIDRIHKKQYLVPDRQDYVRVDRPPNGAEKGAIYSEALLTEKMLDCVNATLQFERQQGNRHEKLESTLRGINRSLDNLHKLFAANSDEIDRIRNYQHFEDTLQKEDAARRGDAKSVRVTPVDIQPEVGKTYFREYLLIPAQGDPVTIRYQSGGTVPPEYAWAKPALEGLQKDIAAVKKVSPELLEAFTSGNSDLVITQGKSTLYEERILGITPHQETKIPNGRSQSVAYRTDKEHGVVSAAIFPASMYPVHPIQKIGASPFLSEVNVFAHEITHEGDRQAPPEVKAGESKIVDIGRHSYSNLFRLAAILDSVFEPHGICNTVRVHLNAADYSRSQFTWLQEIMPRYIENYIGNPDCHAASPLIKAYTENIFLPDMRFKGEGKNARREALSAAIKVSNKEVLGEFAPTYERYVNASDKLMDAKEQDGTWSDKYLAARKEFFEAKDALASQREAIEVRVMDYIGKTKLSADKAANTYSKSFRPGAHGYDGRMYDKYGEPVANPRNDNGETLGETRWRMRHETREKAQDIEKPGQGAEL